MHLRSRLAVPLIAIPAFAALVIGAYFYFPAEPQPVPTKDPAGDSKAVAPALPLASETSVKTNKAKLTLDEGLQKIVNQHMPGRQPEAVVGALKGHLEDTQILLSKLAISPAGSSQILLAQLESKSHEFEMVRDEVLQQLQVQRYEVGDEAEQIAALASFEQQILQRFDRLNDLIQSVVASKTDEDRQQAVSRVAVYIDTLRPPHPAPGAPDPTFTIPAERKSFGNNGELPEIKKATPPAYMTSQRAPSIMVVSVGDLNALNLVLAPPAVEDPEAQSCNFSPEDLAEAAPEVLFDERILQQAEKLDYNPLKIYEFVSNEIEFQAYAGSLKGATATLVSGAGNAVDQASLMIALMRVAKIPTRYVRGAIQFDNDDDRGFNWYGAKTHESMNKIVPTTYYPGNDEYFIYSHTWVEACVAYDNYRGSRADASGYHWIPLDPSYQQHDYVQGDTVPADFSLDEFLYGEDGYMLTRSLKLPHEAFEERLAETLGRAIGPIGYYGSKRKVKHDILPSTLPYTVWFFENWSDSIARSETAALPPEERYRFEITVSKKNGTVIHPAISLDIPEIVLKRVTLRFDGATQSKYDKCATGPKVTPVISVEGVDQDISDKQAVGLCTKDNVLKMKIFRGGDSINETVYRNIGSHNYHALQGYALQASPTLIEERTRALLETVGEVSDPNTLQDETLGEYLHLVGLKYMDYITEANVRISALYNSYGIRGNHIGLASTLKSVSYLFDLPYAVQGDGFLIDVAGGVGGSDDLTTGELNYEAAKLSGYSSSAYESYIWQEMADLDAVSSVRGIQFANENDIAVATLDEEDVLPETWSKISLAAKLRYVCTFEDGQKVVNKPASGFSPQMLSKISPLDDHKNSLGGLRRYNGVPYNKTFKGSSNGVKYTCKLTTPSSKLPRNGYGGLTGYPESTLETMGRNLLSDWTYVAPVQRIQYGNWLGSVYIGASDPDLSNKSITFAISGDYYTAGGGYTTGTPISSNFSYDLGTGYKNLYSSSINTSLSYDSGVSLDNFSPIDLGMGSNTGYVSGTTTLSGDPVNLVSGNMYHPERDIALKGRGGFDFVFERTYNSNIRKDGPLGYGWSHSYQHQLTFFDTTDNNSTKTDQVIWQDGSGTSNSFDVQSNSNGAINVGTVFESQPGLNVIAIRESNGEFSIQEKNGLKYYFENANGKPGITVRVLRVVDRNGNTFTLNYDGTNLESVSDDLGRSLTFHYDDADQHITRVVDWSGRIFRYTYVNNNLVSFETPLAIAGQEPATTYNYYTADDGTNLDHAMESFTRANGESMTYEYYTNGKVFRHLDASGQSFTFRYNKFRRETTTVDERGISQTYLFNEYGQQLTHVQGDGSRMDYKYEDAPDEGNPGLASNPLSETLSRNALGYDTRYEYDDLGNLIESKLPDGSTIRYPGMNEFSLPCTVQNQNGNYQLNRYDTHGNQTETIHLQAGTQLSVEDEASCSYLPPPSTILSHSVNSYDSYGNLLTSKLLRDFNTGDGPATEYVYDAEGLNLVTVRRCGLQQDTDGDLGYRCVSAEQEFDTLGRIKKAVDANFYYSRFEYDDNGRIIRATDDFNQWRDFEYDPNGYPKSEKLLTQKPDGKVGFYINNTTDYDELGRVTRQRNVGGYSTRAEYDETGNVLRITDPDGFSVGFEYDLNNRPVRAFDALGHEVKTDYDIGGRPISVTDPNGNSTQYEYYGAEENGRLKIMSTADNRSLEYFYDANGNVVRTVDNAGRENLTEYDALNRPVRMVGPLHDGHSLANIRNVTVTRYDELGDVVQIDAGFTTNLNGAAGNDLLLPQAIYRYDDFGRLIEQQDPNGKLTEYIYDDHNNLTEKVSPNGHVLEFSYDHARNGLLDQRSAKLSAGDNNPQVTSYQYNALGQVTQVVTPEVTYSYAHDEVNRLSSVSDSRGNKDLNYDYSQGGRLNFVLDSKGKRVDFLYDAVQRLTALIAPNGDQVNFVFDAGGRLRETGIEGGTRSRYRYDEGNKLRTLVNETVEGIISQHDYAYDNLGRRNSHVETIDGSTKSWVFEHDNLDRLTRVLEDAGNTVVEGYSYDSFGNRRTRVPAGGTADHYLYDAAHQLMEVHNGSDEGEVTAIFEYDDNGNLVEQDVGGITRTLAYDALERLQAVSGSDIGTETYAYDDQGRRIAKTVDGAITQYVYSGPSIWSEYGSDWNAALAHYSYTGLDEAIIRSTPAANDIRYYHHDGLGSVVATTNTAGSLQASTRYDAWGQVTSGGGIAQFGFTGREPDASGLIYYRARYYNPALGRFTQRDPSGFAGGLNPYTYVGNAPQNFTDPLGLSQQAVTAMSSQTSAFAGASSQQEDSCSLCGMFAKNMFGGITDSDYAATSAVAPIPIAKGGLFSGAGVWLKNTFGIGSRTKVGGRATSVPKSISTPHGAANQATDAAAMAAREQVQNGASIYRIGTTGKSHAAEAQFWSLENPLSTGYASRYGIPASNVKNANFIETATIKSGSPFVTRHAPGVGSNVGGGIEVVVPQGGVNLRSFNLGEL